MQGTQVQLYRYHDNMSCVNMSVVSWLSITAMYDHTVQQMVKACIQLAQPVD